jgi:hypothetical protein
MDSVKDDGNLEIEVNFKCRKEYHKYLIEFILTYSCLKQSELAELLDISLLTLDQSRKGSTHLSAQAVVKLIELFCTLLGD